MTENRPAAVFKKAAGLILFFLLVLSPFTVPGDGFLEGSVKLNSWLMEPVDAGRDAGIFHSHNYSATLKNGPLNFTSTTYYSDLYDTRLNSYQRPMQIGHTAISFNPENLFYGFWVGRNYLNLINRNLSMDGAGVTLDAGRWAQITALGGYRPPDYFQKEILNTESSNRYFGGQLEILPLPNFQVLGDFHKFTESDTGMAGLETSYRAAKNALISVNGLYDFNTSEIVESSARVRYQLNKNFFLATIAGNEAYSTDSHYVYDSWIHADYRFLKLNATSFHFNRLALTTAWGIQSVEEKAGNLVEISLDGWGVHLGYNTRINENISDHKLLAAWESPLWRFIKIETGSGYHLYEFNKEDDTRSIFYLETGAIIVFKRNSKLAVYYEFQNNPMLSRDHRLRMSLGYNIFKGWGKQ